MQWLTSLGRGGDDGKDEARPGARAAPGGSSLAETRRRVEKLRGYHELAKVGDALVCVVDLLQLCDVAGIRGGAYGVLHGLNGVAQRRASLVLGASMRRTLN